MNDDTPLSESASIFEALDAAPNTAATSGGSASPTILETTMNAIASNRLDPEQRPILLVVERRLL